MREGVIDNKKLTPYRGLDEVLIDYAHTSRAVLGDNFVGLYLLGSLAIGDFDLTSDVDFMIVTNSELSCDQVELVQSASDVTSGAKAAGSAPSAGGQCRDRGRATRSFRR